MLVFVVISAVWVKQVCRVQALRLLQVEVVENDVVGLNRGVSPMRH